MSAKAEKSADPRGLKRVCASCGMRFYDLNKRPITCPTCETEFTGEIKLKGRRGRVAAEPEKETKVKKETAAAVANDQSTDNDEIDMDEDLVSLDDVKDAEGDDDDDDELDDMGGDLDVVLEEEDDQSDIELDVKVSTDKDD